MTDQAAGTAMDWMTWAVNGRSGDRIDRHAAIDAAETFDEDTLDEFVERVRRREGLGSGWSLYGFDNDGQFAKVTGGDGDAVSAMIGHRADRRIVALGLHTSGVAHFDEPDRRGAGLDAAHIDAQEHPGGGLAVAATTLVTVDGRRRHLVTDGVAVVARGGDSDGLVPAALGRLLDVAVEVDARRTALALLAGSCVEAALDGGDITAVAVGDLVVLTAAVLDHLGGVGHGKVDGAAMTRQALSMVAGATMHGDWVDTEVLDLVGDRALRFTAAGLAQEWLGYTDREANWWGPAALVAQLDALLVEPDEFLALAARYDFDLAAAVGRVIVQRRQRWGIVN